MKPATSDDTPTSRSRWAIIAPGLAAAVALGAALAIDQLVKAWALQSLTGGRTIELLPLVSLRLTFNPGAAFGLGAGAGPLFAIVPVIIAAALSALLIAQIIRKAPIPNIVALSVAVGGATGNLYDRITRATQDPLDGTVIDMIAIDWFAILNIADVFITCGIAAWALLTVYTGAGRHGRNGTRSAG